MIRIIYKLHSFFVRILMWTIDEPVFSSSFSGRFYFMHSLRSKFLHRSIKKNERKILKMKKVRATFRKILRFFEIEKFSIFPKIFIEICMKTKNFEIKKIENFRSKKSQNFSLKIVWKWKFSRSKFFDLKKVQKIFRKVSLTFFVFNIFSICKKQSREFFIYLQDFQSFGDSYATPI